MAGDARDSVTKPTIETVLQRINSLGESLQGQLNSLHADVGILKSDVATLKSDVATLKTGFAALSSDLASFRNEFQLFRSEMTIRIDRIDGLSNQTQADLLHLRADCNERKERRNDSPP